MNRRPSVLLGTAAWVMAIAFCLTGSVHAAEIYKWKDEKGVVHYSNTPPPKGTDSSVLDESKGKVSVVPGYKPPASAASPSGDPALQDRVRQLERQVEQERQSQSSTSQSQAEAYERWRADCLAQRRTDCDNPGAAVGPVYGDYPVAPVVRPPGRPVKPSYPSVVPPGYTVGPGPGGIGGAYVPNPPPLVQPGQPSPVPPRPVPQPR